MTSPEGLVGRMLPALRLPATFGSLVDLSALPGRTVLYLYPRTSEPGAENPDGWDVIPGARGCTPEACSFRDHFAELRAAGARRVFGLSTQSTDVQAESVDRLHLQFAMLSDPHLTLAAALDLPTFSIAGERFYERLTVIARDSVIETVFSPIPDPAGHAEEVLASLRG